MRRQQHIRWSFVPALILLLTTLPAVSQEKEDAMRIGMVARYSVDFSSVRLPVYAGSFECGTFEQGWAQGPLLGGRFTFPRLLFDVVGISPQLTGRMSSATYSVTAPEPFVTVAADAAEARTIDHEYRLSVRDVALSLDLLLDLSVNDRLTVRFGPALGYRIGTTISQTDYILDDTFRFADGTRTMGMGSRPDLTVNDWIAGAAVGGSWSIPAGDGLEVMPEVMLRSRLTSLFAETSASNIGIEFGVAVMKRTGGTDPLPPDIDSLPAEPEAASARTPDEFLPPALRASIAVSGIDDAGNRSPDATIELFETYTRTSPTSAWGVKRESTPPTLMIDPTFDARNGVMGWQVRFEYDGVTIGEATHRAPDELSRIDWKVGDIADADSLGPLTVRLSVTDSTGESVTASDNVRLQVRKHSRAELKLEGAEYHTLFPVDLGEDVLEGQNREIIRKIVGDVRPGSVVTIRGYAQRKGGPRRQTTVDDLLAVKEELEMRLGEQGLSGVRIQTELLPDIPSRYDAPPMPERLQPQIEIEVETAE